MNACRDKLRSALNGGKPAHAGLMLARYLPETADKSVAAKALMERARQAAAECASIYKAAFTRWSQETSGHQTATLSVQNRLVVGLGNSSPTETGITMHHTYGVPFIPGSSLKGVCAHYCHDVWGAKNELFQFEKEAHKALFGETDDCGHIVFEDAWILPESLTATKEGLLPDVLTPHHSEYYTGNEGRGPTDFDDPVPVPFVSVRGRFRVALECDLRGADGDRWASLAMTLLKEALKGWGAGGKTRSGYGRLV